MTDDKYVIEPAWSQRAFIIGLTWGVIAGMTAASVVICVSLYVERMAP